MWYDNSRLLSYNGLMNFVLSNRGGGKSFNSKDWCIRDFKKTGKQFVYVRRYKEELKKIQFFFDDIREFYPNDKLEVKGKLAYINGEVAGHFIALTTSQKEKSTSYPLVNKIIFDEFIVDKGHIRYIKNEVEIFMDLLETVDRKRDETRCLFLANNVSTINPYFTYFNVRVKPDKRFNVAKDGLVVVEMFTDMAFIEEKKKTRLGRLVEGTRYGDYLIHNKSLRDDDTFIKKDKPQDSRFLYSFILDGKEYGCWQSIKEDMLYFNNQVDTSSKFRYSITKSDHSPNLTMIIGLKRRIEIKSLLYFYEQGRVFFSNQSVKTALYEILSMLNVK